MADVTLNIKEYEELKDYKKKAEHYLEAINKLEDGNCCIVREKDKYAGTLIVHTSVTIIPYSDGMKILTDSLEALKEHVGHMSALREGLKSLETTVSNAFIGKHYPKDFPDPEYRRAEKARDIGFREGVNSERLGLKTMGARELRKYRNSL